MYAQRDGLDRRQRQIKTALWQPPPPEKSDSAVPRPDESEFEPTDRDAYVVVDDLEADRAVVVVTPWPRLDASGRLVFAVPQKDEAGRQHWDQLHRELWKRDRRRGARPQDLPHEFVLTADPARLQTRIDEEREAKGQLRRPLRLGDAFRVRDIQGPDPSAWRDILDVTAEARDAARAALYGAIAPKFDRKPRPSDEQRDDPVAGGRRASRQPRRGPTAGASV
jgi:hypothetical protein